MLGSNPFVDLLFRNYIKRDKNRLLRFSGHQETVAKAIIKLSCGQVVLPKTSELKARVDQILNLTNNNPIFGEIIESTIFKYRRRDDELRYLEFLVRSAKSESKISGKPDRRRESVDVRPAVALFDQYIKGRNIDAYKTSNIKAFDPLLKIGDVKKRMEKFSKELQIMTGFIEQLYYNMQDGHPKVEGMKEFRDGFDYVNKRISSAMESSSKDQAELDEFAFLTYHLLRVKGEDRLVKLQQITNLIGCDRGWSLENRSRILGKRTKTRIEESRSLRRILQKLC